MNRLSMCKLAKPLSALLVILNTAAALPAVPALADEDLSYEVTAEAEAGEPASGEELVFDSASGQTDESDPQDVPAVPEAPEPLEDAGEASLEDEADPEGTEAADENAGPEEIPDVDGDGDGQTGEDVPQGYDFPRDDYGYRYYIDPDTGYRHTGWLQLEGLWYYFWSDGTLATGWVMPSDGYWYYFNKDTGVVHRGWIDTSDGNRYYMRPEDATEQTYWRQIDGYWYYFGSDGKMRRGWNKANDGYWYYFDMETGIVYRGWIETSDGNWYYMRPEDATEQTGWREIDGYWYYFGDNGRMRTGWQLLGGCKYYFYKDGDDGPKGANAANVTIDGYYVNSSGYTTESWGVWEKMVKLAENTESDTDYLIIVDVDYCKLGVFKGSKGNWSGEYYWSCSPGKASTPTVRGHFTIDSRGLYFYSGSAICWYWSEFYNGEYAIHSVLYYPGGYVMDGRTGMFLSHGCVRIDYDNAYWIYENCPLGTAVYVY